mgnify:CR=1 FL=1
MKAKKARNEVKCIMADEEHGGVATAVKGDKAEKAEKRSHPRSRRPKKPRKHSGDDAWASAPKKALRGAMQTLWDDSAAKGRPMRLSEICAAEDWRIPAGEIAVRRLYQQRLKHGNLTEEQAEKRFKIGGTTTAGRDRSRRAHYG